MKYRRKTAPKWQLHAALSFAVVVLLFTLFRLGVLSVRPVLLSPLPDNRYEVVSTKEIVMYREENADTWIDRYAYEYTQTKEEAEYLKFQLHCLYWKEARNGMSDAKGDGGRAAGPMQFHRGTYVAMVGQMMSEGLRDDAGSRLDVHDSIQVAAWAISLGEGKQWGPILRGECI